MTDLAEGRETRAGGRAGRLFLRVLLTLIIISPIGVGFWLAPKADDMPPPPEFEAPPRTSLPDAVLRALPPQSHDQSSANPMTFAATAEQR